MPDTEENQKEYPQPGTQKKGTSFPVSGYLFSYVLAAAHCSTSLLPIKGKKQGSRLCPGRCYPVCVLAIACWLCCCRPALTGSLKKRVPDVLIVDNVMESQVARMGYSNVNDHASDWMSQALYEQMLAELRSVLSKTNVRLSLPFDWMQKSPPGQTSSPHT